MLFAATPTHVFSSSTTTRARSFAYGNFDMSVERIFVFTSGRTRELTTRNRSCRWASERADKSAARRAFLFNFLAKFRKAVGPNVTPPPFQIGERVEPWRARPVPFCFHGFLPPPRTSPRSLV